MSRYLSRLILVRTEREYTGSTDAIAEHASMLPDDYIFAVFDDPNCDQLSNLTFEYGASDLTAIQTHMAKGDTLVVVLSGSDVASRGLIRHSGYTSFEAKRNDRAIGPDEHFIHYCRTAKTFAGQGLYRHILTRSATHIGSRHPDATLIISCNDKNVASIKGIERSGFTLRRRVLTVGFLGGRYSLQFRAIGKNSGS